jgi:peptidyl-prolyl cis-trans isomerase B (cyclophilin B)
MRPRPGYSVPMTHTRRAAALFVSAIACLLTAHASAQLTPDRLYYGVDRTMPMTVAAEGDEVVIKLMDPADSSELASALAMAGGVDLAGLFPTLWTDKRENVLFAQLVVDGTPTGAPVVLDPMISVDKATMVNPQTMQPVQPGQRGRPFFESERASMTGQPRRVTYSGIRAYVSKDVVFETEAGDIRVRLRPDKAPNHAWNFRSLVDGGYYTEIIFHRIIPGFVIQVGDPTGTGSGGPGYQIDLERSDLPHDFGVLSMARTPDPNSGGSQIFICLTRERTAMLDGLYTAFGQTIAGADTVVALGNTPVEGDKPIDPPLLENAYLTPSAPFGTGPMPVQRPAEAEATDDAEPEAER